MICNVLSLITNVTHLLVLYCDQHEFNQSYVYHSLHSEIMIDGYFMTSRSTFLYWLFDPLQYTFSDPNYHRHDCDEHKKATAAFLRKLVDSEKSLERGERYWTQLEKKTGGRFGKIQ